MKWNIDGHIRLAKPSRPDPRFVLSDALVIGAVSTSCAQPTFVLQAPVGSRCAPIDYSSKKHFFGPAWFAQFALEIAMSSSCCLHRYRWTPLRNLLLRVDGRTVSPHWKGNRKCTHVMHAITGVVRWPMIQQSLYQHFGRWPTQFTLFGSYAEDSGKLLVEAFLRDSIS